jgi:RHS repeat-associated protein
VKKNAQVRPADVSTAYKAAVLNDKPVVYYRLDDATGSTATDSSGNATDATYQSGVSRGVPGALLSDPADTAVTSTGSVLAQAGNTMPSGSEPRTLEIWTAGVNGGFGSSPLPFIGYGGGAGGEFEVLADSWNNTLTLTDGKQTVETSGRNMFDGHWHLLDAVDDGTNGYIYLDGQLIAQGVLKPNTNVPGSGLFLATVSGSYDEMAVYSKPLSGPDIVKHWLLGASQAAQTCVTPPTSPYARAVLANAPKVYYRLDDFEQSGNRFIAYDSSGNCTNAVYRSSSGTEPVTGGILGDPDGAVISNARVLDQTGDTLPQGDSARTLEIWTAGINGGFGSSPLPLFGYGGTGTNQFTIFADSWNNVIEVTDGAQTVSAPGGHLFDGHWHIIDVTEDGNMGYIYLDGLLLNQGPLHPNTSVPGGSGLFIASDHGQYDEAAVYPTVLSLAQIQHHATVGGIVVAPPPTPREFRGGCSRSERAACSSRACAGDPVDCASGNLSETYTDISIPGRGFPLLFARTYNSQAASQTGAAEGPLGYGWTSNVFMSLSADQPSAGDVTVSEEGGSQLTFTPNGDGTFSAPPRVAATLVKNGDGSYTFKRLNQDSFSLNSSGQLTQQQNLNGYKTSYAYDGNGHLTTMTDSAGRTLTLTWTGPNVTQVSDPDGRTAVFTYDASGNLATATDVNGKVSSFTYDTNHEMLSFTNPRGVETDNSYDSNGRVAQQTVDPPGLNLVTQFAYTGDNFSQSGGTTTITDPAGNVAVESFVYGELQSMTRGSGSPQAATWQYAYDQATLGQTMITDPNGAVTVKTYDRNGNVLSVTDPVGRTTTYTYNALNEKTSVTNPAGTKTTYKYDTHGNLTSVLTPVTGSSEPQLTTYVYDPAHAGDVTSMTDPNGHVWKYTYDQYGDRASLTDPAGNETTYSYNDRGWLMSEVSPRGNATGASPSSFTTTDTRDKFGSVLTITDPLGHVTTRTYDANQNLLTVTDALGKKTTYVYDNADEQTEVQRPGGTRLDTAFNPDGTILSQTDAAGHTTTYGYDALARLTSVTDPLRRQTSYGYDGAGNRTSVINALGKVTSYSYNAADELTGIRYKSATTPDVTAVTYDADGNRTSMKDGTGTSHWTYDSLNRLTSYTNGAGAKVAYKYDPVGNVVSVTYPNGKKVTKTYDSDNRLASVSDWLGNNSVFGYDANSDITSETFPKSTKEVDTFGYDPGDNLTSITDKRGSTVLVSFAYTRDADNLLTNSSATGVGQSPEADTYTALNQLRKVNSTTCTYGKADVVTGLACSHNPATFKYDIADQLTSQTLGGKTTKFTYNLDGDRTSQKPASGTATTYAYDQADRLISVVQGATKATDSYSGDGLRMSQSVNGTQSQFAWDTSGSLPLVITNGTTMYLYGPAGLPLEQISGTSAVFLHHDQLGSTRLLTSSSGSKVATYTYGAFGNTASKTGGASTPLQYAGQLTDVKSGLQYLRARFYDPASGQFVTRDPVAAVTWSPYGYAENNPLFLTDPRGLWPWDLIAEGVGLVTCFALDLPDAEITEPACDIGWSIGVHILFAENVGGDLPPGYGGYSGSSSNGRYYGRGC